jgi:membrane protein implicated in regulation of membrane protease activity
MILGIPSWIVWLVLLVVFLIVEALTLGLATIWFAGGALAAILVSLITNNVFIQAAVMIVVSVALLLLFVFLIKPKLGALSTKAEPTNADRVIGMEGIVTESIQPDEGVGLVKVGGQIWSAITEDRSALEAGQRIVVKEIKGVKLIVNKL